MQTMLDMLQNIKTPQNVLEFCRQASCYIYAYDVRVS